MKRRIIQIHQSLDIGGIENVIIQLSNKLNRSKYSVYACAISNECKKSEDLSNDVIFNSLKYPISSIRRFNLIVRFPLIICQLGKYFKKVNPDIIHIHSYFTIYLLVSIAARLYVKNAVIIRTVHTSGLFYSSKSLYSRFQIMIEQLATFLNRTYIVGISNQVFEICNRLFLKCACGVKLVYNGIDLNNFDKEPNKDLRKKLLGDKELLAIYVARYDDGKNHDFLVSLWKSLISIGVTNTKLLLVGDGKNIKRIKEKIIKEGLEDYIICNGRSDKVNELLKISDFALFPSDFEGFSLSLIEKMASGLLVVASDIPAFREVISNGYNGYTIPISDYNKWVYTVDNVIGDSYLRHIMGIRARERSCDFSVDKMIDGYEKIYEHCR